MATDPSRRIDAQASIAFLHSLRLAREWRNPPRIEWLGVWDPFLLWFSKDTWVPGSVHQQYGIWIPRSDLLDPKEEHRALACRDALLWGKLRLIPSPKRPRRPIKVQSSQTSTKSDDRVQRNPLDYANTQRQPGISLRLHPRVCYCPSYESIATIKGQGRMPEISARNQHHTRVVRDDGAH